MTNQECNRVENTNADQRSSRFINKQLNTSLNSTACVRGERKHISLIIKTFSDILAHACRVGRAPANSVNQNISTAQKVQILGIL